MIEPDHRQLSITNQCRWVSTSRSALYYQPKGETTLNLNLKLKLKLMRLIDRQWMKTPHFGTRGMTRHLRRSAIWLAASGSGD